MSFLGCLEIALRLLLECDVLRSEDGLWELLRDLEELRMDDADTLRELQQLRALCAFRGGDSLGDRLLCLLLSLRLVLGLVDLSLLCFFPLFFFLSFRDDEELSQRIL